MLFRRSQTVTRKELCLEAQVHNYLIGYNSISFNLVILHFLVSLVCVFIILYLVYSEVKDFLHSGVKFHFVPDDDLDTRMDLNVDMTVAMPCRCKILQFQFWYFSFTTILYCRYWSRCLRFYRAECCQFWSSHRGKHLVSVKP